MNWLRGYGQQDRRRAGYTPAAPATPAAPVPAPPAGGSGESRPPEVVPIECPRCQSRDLKVATSTRIAAHIRCKACDHLWKVTTPVERVLVVRVRP